LLATHRRAAIHRTGNSALPPLMNLRKLKIESDLAELVAEA
jgi:hypothetical protein